MGNLVDIVASQAESVRSEEEDGIKETTNAEFAKVAENSFLGGLCVLGVATCYCCCAVDVFFAAAASSAFSTSTAFSICASRPLRKSAGVLSTYTSGGTP